MFQMLALPTRPPLASNQSKPNSRALQRRLPLSAALPFPPAPHASRSLETSKAKKTR